MLNRQEKDIQLQEAAAAGDVEKCKALLKDGAYINAMRRQEDSPLFEKSPLMLACEHGHLAVVQLLLSYSFIILINIQNKNNQTALSLAISNNQLAVVDELLKREEINVYFALREAIEKQKPDIALRLLLSDQNRNIYHRTLLIFALQKAKTKDDPIVVKLLNHPNMAWGSEHDGKTLKLIMEKCSDEIIEQVLNHPDININAPLDHDSRGTPGHTVLTAMIAEGNNEAVEKLLRHPRINVNATGNHETPLRLAIKTKNRRIFRLCLDHPNIDVTATAGGLLDPLMLAIQNGQHEMVAELSNQKAIDINARHYLAFALNMFQHEIANLLLDHPNINLMDSDVLSAVRVGYEDIVRKMLARKKFNIDAGNLFSDFGNYNNSLLSELIRNRLAKLAKEVIPQHSEKSINLDSCDRRTPLTHAIETNQVDIFEALLNTPGIDINHKNQNKTTALSAAIWGKNETIIRRLVFLGAKVEPKNLGHPMGEETLGFFQGIVEAGAEEQFKQMTDPSLSLEAFKEAVKIANALTQYLNLAILNKRFKECRAQLRDRLVLFIDAQEKEATSPDLLAKLKHLKDNLDLIKPNAEEAKKGQQKTAMKKLVGLIGKIETATAASEATPNWGCLFDLSLTPEQATAALDELNQKTAPSMLDSESRKVARKNIVTFIDDVHRMFVPNAPIDFLENLSKRITLIKETLAIIQPNEKEKKNHQDKTAMQALKALEQRVNVHLQESKNQVDLIGAAKAILNSDNLNDETLNEPIKVLLNTPMEACGRFQLELLLYIDCIRELNDTQIDKLQEKLKSIALGQEGRARVDVQNKLRTLLLETQTPYEKNPFLFILRFDKQSSTQKNTAAFKAVEETLVGKKPGFFSRAVDTVKRVKILTPAPKGPTLSKKNPEDL